MNKKYAFRRKKDSENCMSTNPSKINATLIGSEHHKLLTVNLIGSYPLKFTVQSILSLRKTPRFLYGLST